MSGINVLVLVCSLGQTPNLADCDATNARYVIRLSPALVNSLICTHQGQSFLAGTELGKLAEDERLKVICKRAP